MDDQTLVRAFEAGDLPTGTVASRIALHFDMFYRLTAKGRAQLKAERGNWIRLSEAIALILRSAEG